MKNLEILDFDTNETGIAITHESRAYLQEAAKWGKFLAIVGFVFIGIIALIAVFAGSIMGTMMGELGGGHGFPGGGIFLTVLYLGIAALYFFPCLYLYKFSTQTKMALLTNSTQGLSESLKNLKSMFKFMGIFTAVILSLYALIFISSLLFMGASF
ncbi:MAG: hypothetical protein ACI9XO_004794 [Paraglaciecola sp.]|jgi:hypothetical protein